MNKIYLFLSGRCKKCPAGKDARNSRVSQISLIFSPINALRSLRSFAGWVVSPITAAFNVGNAGLRMKRSSRLARLVCTLLLTGTFGLVLAGCGDGGSGGGDRTITDPRAAANIETTVSGNNITVSWTNPNLENITGFKIEWVNVGDDAELTDRGEMELDADESNVSAGAKDNTYTIMNLTYDATYEITVAVLYQKSTPAVSAPVRETTGMPAAKPPGNGGNGGNGVTTNLPAVSDVQRMVSGNNITVSWTNPAQENITGFKIEWVNVDAEPTDRGEMELDSDESNVSASAKDNTYTITGLAYNAIYNITIAVRYESGDPAVSVPVQATTGMPATKPPGNGGNGGNGVTTNLPAVSDIEPVVGEEHILVSWTNPNQMNIIGFNITWVNVDADVNGKGMRILRAANVDVLLRTPAADLLKPESRVMYNITGLTNGERYEIRIAVLYQNGISVVSAPIIGTPGMDDPDGGDGGDATFPAIANPQAMASGNNITVSWTNPDQDGQDEIIGFNITWINDADATDRGSMELDATTPGVLVEPGAESMYTIPNLNYDTTYKITVSVRYEDQDPIPSAPIQGTIAINPEGDEDDDNVVNREDADYDGDGLIEIRTLDDLALLNNDLNGDGTDGDMGCPSSGCKGYELTRSLNFSDPDSYADGMVNPAWTTGSGWTPIGSCGNEDDCDSYSGIFEGNNRSIFGLFIMADNTVNGTGLFAAFSGIGRNLRLSDASVTGGDDTGLFVGFADTGHFENISVAGMVAGVQSVGTLAGDVTGATIVGVNAKESNIIGAADTGTAGDFMGRVGGLIGDAHSTNISYSYVTGSTINSVLSGVGGLVGRGMDTNIRNSYVADSSVLGARVQRSTNVGGLIGGSALASADIRQSWTAGVSLLGGRVVGGLMGGGDSVDIRHSYVTAGSVDADSQVGGLIGQVDVADIRYSYAVSSSSVTDNDPESIIAGGLVGSTGFEFSVNTSYWDNITTGQSTSAGNKGEGKTTDELQMPTDFAGSIYEVWGNFVCDPNTGDVMESSDGSIPANSRFTEYVWDLGNEMQYPVLNCHPVSVEEQQQQQ